MPHLPPEIVLEDCWQSLQKRALDLPAGIVLDLICLDSSQVPEYESRMHSIDISYYNIQAIEAMRCDG
jgi:hypothetical protein